MNRPFSLPRQKSLPETVAGEIERQIRAGEFADFLPGTRMLAALFGVSLPTLNRALRILKREGLVEVRQGAPTRVLPARLPARPESAVVGLLLPENLPAGVCWPQHEIINRVQTALLAKGITPLLFPSRQKGAHSDRRWLETATGSARVDLWLLLSPTLEVQRFFDEKKYPAMVLGSLAPASNLALPCIGIDQPALGNHAAGTLWRLGHRRILYVRDHVDRVGEQILLEHFSARMHALSNGEAVVSVIRSPHDRDGTARALEKALRPRVGAGGAGISACFFTHASTALSALTYLSRTNRRVPEELSVLCAQYADFHHQVHPSIAAYHLNLQTLENRLLRCLEECLHRFSSRREAPDLLIPELMQGESLGSATDQRR